MRKGGVLHGGMRDGGTTRWKMGEGGRGKRGRGGGEGGFFFLGKCGRERDGIECECVKEVDGG